MQPGVEAGEGNQWTLYAEAILLPFCLHIVGESSAPSECSYLPMANIQMDLRNSRMTNWNKRPDAKYQEGGFEGSNADLDNRHHWEQSGYRVQYPMLCVFSTE